MGTNQIIIVGYVVVGLFAMVAFSVMSGNFYMGFATGLLLILGAALGHEFTIRREGFSKVVRGVIGLRETVDRADGAVSRMQADFEKTVAESRAARESLNQIQSMHAATEEQIKALQEQIGQGGGEDIGRVQQTVQQVQAQQKQTTEDIALIQNAGNQLHGEFQAMQQQLTTLQQQMQQMQSHMQDSIQQVHSTVNAMMAGSGVAAPAAPPPPPPPLEATPQPVAPQPEAPPQLEPEEAAAQAEPPPQFEPEQAAAQAEPQSAPVTSPPPMGGDFVGWVFETLQDQLGGLGGDPVDTSLRAVAEGLIGDAVDLYVEPVVTLPERKLAFFECYGGVRGADGNALTIDQDLDMSGRESLMAAIENALMIRCMERMEKLDVSGIETGKCFYNVPGVTLADRNFFSGLLGHLQTRPALAGRMVMEFAQSALMEHGEKGIEDLVQIQECGCSFSIDEITDLAIDFESLVGFGFRFAKVGSKFIRTQASASKDPETVRSLAGTLKDQGIDLIVETVETDLSLVELIAFEIAYGQGPLFGQPSITEG